VGLFARVRDHIDAWVHWLAQQPALAYSPAPDHRRIPWQDQQRNAPVNKRA
jgi:hypothetical protein